MTGVTDINVEKLCTLLPPRQVKEKFPASEKTLAGVLRARHTIADILSGKDKRMIVWNGPCSVHSKIGMLAFNGKLAELANAVSDVIFMIERTFVAKPRTKVAWGGIYYEPEVEGVRDERVGAMLAREILLAIAETDMPVSTEYLDGEMPQYIDDLVSWYALGARTVQTPSLRQVGSGLSAPVGCKNSTDGEISNAVDAVEVINHSQYTRGMDQDARVVWAPTKGNAWSHVVLRGGASGPNYDANSVRAVQEMLRSHNLLDAVAVDCSHGNSGKKFKKQIDVARNVVEQRISGNDRIIGLMLESYIKEGSVKENGLRVPESKKLSEYDPELSITDGCLGWEDMEGLVLELAASLRKAPVRV